MPQSRVLYVDATPQSKEAEAMLRKANLDFHSIFIKDPAREGKATPQLLTAEGIFPTIEDIRWYSQAYGKSGDRSY